MAKEEKVVINNKREYVSAVGRRREAIARVRLYDKDVLAWEGQEIKRGEIFVNRLPIHVYFSGNITKAMYTKPFSLTDTADKFLTTIKVVGGGKRGQLEAVVHGIARALNAYNREKFRSVLKKHGLLTRDARIRQRRSVGMGGKSRRKKQSPKR